LDRKVLCVQFFPLVAFNHHITNNQKLNKQSFYQIIHSQSISYQILWKCFLVRRQFLQHWLVADCAYKKEHLLPRFSSFDPLLLLDPSTSSWHVHWYDELRLCLPLRYRYYGFHKKQINVKNNVNYLQIPSFKGNLTFNLSPS